jgi:2-dehydro-3-deoxyphosphogalactonate aldolase
VTATAGELQRRLSSLPLVAILRGLDPSDAEAVGATLIGHGFRVLEVPLNSPRPFESIEILAARFGREALIGAGTVLERADVARVETAGGRLVVMPHADLRIVAEAKRQGLACVPGVATPTEAFAALATGADALKLFPGEMLSPPVVKAWRSVLPVDSWLLPVGGITPERMQAYWESGANGFGIGSALFKPGLSSSEVGERARRFVAAFASLPARRAP